MDRTFPYSYTPLNPSEDIRLVTLEPGVEGSPLTYCLVTARFVDNPVYEALSYVWGSQHNPRLIALDGRLKQITSNLWLALSHLREYDKTHLTKGQNVEARVPLD